VLASKILARTGELVRLVQPGKLVCLHADGQGKVALETKVGVFGLLLA